MTASSAKQLAREVVERLPEDATLDDAIERLIFLAKIERGLVEADAGRLIPHEDVRARFGRPRRGAHRPGGELADGVPPVGTCGPGA